MPASSFGRLWLLAVLLHASGSHAQVTATPSPHSLGTTVAATPTSSTTNAYDIKDGSRSGTNLFHSFGTFSLNPGDVASFTNGGLPPPPTSNIIGRVTGELPNPPAVSNIFGTIDTTAFGTANLFLINPAGWVFGAGAILQVGGSFHVSTADYVRFSDGAQFFANPANASVLSAAPPTAFGFLPPTGPTSHIVVDGAFLQIPDGQTLSFVGGDVQINASTLVVPSGRIQVGSFASAGEAAVDGLDGTFATLGTIQISSSSLSTADFSGLGGGAVVIRGDQVTIDGGSVLDTSGDSFSSPGGPISIRGGQLTVDGATIGSFTFGGDVNGGAIDLSASQGIRIINGSLVTTQTFTFNSGLGPPPGRGGDIHLAAPRVEVEGATVSTAAIVDGAAGSVSVQAGILALSAGGSIGSSSGNGPGGSINIVANEKISIDGSNSVGPSSLFTTTGGPGAAGPLIVSTPSLILSQGGTILTSSFFGSPAGDVSLSVGSLSITTGATINSQNDLAGGGNINVMATGPVTISSSPSGIFTATCQTCPASADISIHAQSIAVSDGALIRSGSNSLQPGGGKIALSAIDSIVVSELGGISTTAVSQNVGPISVSASNLMVDRGFISTTALGSARGGDFTAQVGSVTLTRGGQITSGTPQVGATGAGGDISITANNVAISGASPDNVPVTPFTTIASSGIFSISQSSGKAGQVIVAAPTLSIADTGTISVATSAGGAAGSIALNVSSASLSNGATVNSSTSGSGAGGAISLNGTSVSINGAGTGLFSTASSSGNAGMISVASSTLAIGNAGRISASTTTGSGNAGTITTNVATLSMSGGGTIESSTNSAGAGGSISVQASNLSMSGAATAISSTAASTGNAGQITLSGGSANIADGAKVSVTTSGSGNAGTITANVGSMSVSGGLLDSSTSAAGAGGAINVNAGSVVSVLNGGRISADSTGAGFTGNITIAAGDHITMTGGSISTRALTSDGGNITLKAPLLVRLEDTQITTSVQSGVGGGGNVLIDPQFVLMNNSTVSANAFGGPGGNITIIADNFVASPTALLVASSALSTPGVIAIRSPENNLAGSIAQLPRAFTDASRLMRGACSARHEGLPSSFTLAGRGGVPPEADGYLPSMIATAPSAPLAFALARLDDCAR